MLHAAAPEYALEAVTVDSDRAYLHDGPAEEGDDDHGEPRGHLGEAPQNVGDRDGELVLGEEAVEWVPVALIRGGLLVLAVNDKLLEGLGGGGGAVQGDIADSGRGSRLVGKGLGDLEVVQRWRADRPRVAKDGFLVAVDGSKLGGVRLGGEDGQGSLRGLAN